jgi:hypothetical protein
MLREIKADERYPEGFRKAEDALTSAEESLKAYKAEEALEYANKSLGVSKKIQYEASFILI